jgi:Ca2+-binding RTX toxin-like protein
VFQTTLEGLQENDRFYYLNRTPGLNLRNQLEGNSFTELVLRNTQGTDTFKADAFATADCKFVLSRLQSPAAAPAAITGPGSVADDPESECNENALLLRKPDGTFQYRSRNSEDPPGINGQSVYQGADDVVDRVFGGNDNDTIWGAGGNDILEGNGGDDVIFGGKGNDVVTDLDGADILEGGDDNDAIESGPGADIVLGGDGKDFTNAGINDNETFAGPDDDFIIAGAGADAVFGDGGDDWVEGGSGQDLLQGDHGAPFFDDPGEGHPGHEVFAGQDGENDYDAEGGDDLMSQNAHVDRNAGAGGFDWAFHQYDTVGADDDMAINNFLDTVPLPVVVNRDRWQETEADSGSRFNDIIKGVDDAPKDVGGGGFTGCDALDQAGINRISGLNELVTTLPTALTAVEALSATGTCPLEGPNVWAEGDILLGGGGGDTIEGRGADDIIDGDRALHVRISVRATRPIRTPRSAARTSWSTRPSPGTSVPTRPT